MTFQTIDTGKQIELRDITMRRGEVINHDDDKIIKYYNCSSENVTDSACDFNFYTYRDLVTGQFKIAESLTILQG